MDDRNFLALDLEMNNLSDHEPGRIIQVGIAIGTLNVFRLNKSQPSSKINYIEKTWYIHPEQKIAPRITELTGITDEDVDTKSTPIELVHHEIQALMSQYGCYPNPVVWGHGDASLFKQEVREKLGHVHVFGHREIDVKTLHTFNLICTNRKTNSSLKSALAMYKLKFEGIPHRATDDARNTLSLFFHLMDKQEKTLDVYDQVSRIKNDTF